MRLNICRRRNVHNTPAAGKALVLFAVTLSWIALTPSAAFADDPAPARAESDHAGDAHSHGEDYSRFSDGPRRVPVPRGAAFARAQKLGLGTLRTASRLLHGRARPSWVAAAHGRAPRPLLWPVDQGRFGRGFGYVRRTLPDKRHNGVDIVAEEGQTVRAAADGIVAYSDNGIRGYGNCLLVVHSNGWVTLYAHLYRATVQAGWRVRRGERIGFVGNTGISRGPHLHFELHVDGQPVDPLSNFEGRPWIEAYREWRASVDSGTHRPPTAHLDRQPVDDSTPAPEGDAPATPAVDPSMRDFGTERFARRLMKRAPPAAAIAATSGSLYRNLLWPVRGGTREQRQGRGVRIDAEEGDPVRASADGLVVYEGELRGMGSAVVVLHRNGWVTAYGHNQSTHVQVGQQVRRGEWIARVGRSRGRDSLTFKLYERGRARDPRELFVQVPDDVRRARQGRRNRRR